MMPQESTMFAHHCSTVDNNAILKLPISNPRRDIRRISQSKKSTLLASKAPLDNLEEVDTLSMRPFVHTKTFVTQDEVEEADIL